MDDRKIEYFLTLSEQLNYSKAAEILNITQSTLSRSIMSMESEIGICLFERTTNKIRLTPAGMTLIEGLRDIKDRYAAAISQADSLQNGFSGQLKIGVAKGQSLYMVRRVLRKYQELHPDIKITLLSENLSSLRCMLDNHTLDFAVGYLGDFSFVSRFAYKTLGRIPLRLVVAKDHRFAARKDGSLRLIDFKDENFILVPESETPSVHNFIQCCGNAGFCPKVTEVPDLLTVNLWIGAGYGVAALTEASVSFGSPGLEFLVLPELEAPELAIIWANDCNSQVDLAFINFLQNDIDLEKLLSTK